MKARERRFGSASRRQGVLAEKVREGLRDCG